MTLPSQHYLAVTVLGAGCPGIVNTIARHINSYGCSIEGSRLAMLGEEFTFIILLSDSQNAIILIGSALSSKGAELDLLIMIEHTAARLHPSVPTSVRIQVDVADSPRLTEHFTALFDTCHVNIAGPVSRTQPVESEGTAQLHIQIITCSPASAGAVNIEQASKALCTELNA